MQENNVQYSSGSKPTELIDSSVIRLGGDSGDGMQLVGDLFTNTCAIFGDYFATLPDYPSEIRAPAGTIFGVSGFQLCIGGSEVFTPGDMYDTLIAMNPAALKVNLPQVRKGGTVIINEDAFIPKNLEKAGYTENPLDQSETWKNYRLVRVPMTSATQNLLSDLPLSSKEADRCKNFFALGVLLWLYNRSPEYSRKWMTKKFERKADILKANMRTFEGGLQFGETCAALNHRWNLKKSGPAPKAGVYRNITGNQAAAMGLMAAAERSGLRLFLGSYPITPATDIMHELSKYPDFATVFQAEDEIAGIGSAIGAAFGGALAATNTSGPGFSLKSEFMNLAVMTELPLVIIDVQRAGPSTGIPTKTEQSDMMQAMFGRHGESPMVVMAASTPKDCFDTAVEASRIALKYMTPVIMLSEGYLGNGSEVWRVPELDELPSFPAKFRTDPTNFKPYERDPETLARPWAIPGTPGLEHRLGGLEKLDGAGTVSQDGPNHEKMTHLRAAKVAKVAQDIPKTEVYGHPEAELLVLGWGGTAGVIKSAVRNLSGQGYKVACAHIRYLNPLPPDLESLLKKYKKVLLPELNSGQLWYRLRAELLINTEKLNKMQGQPFRIDEIESKIKSLLGAH
ncbi:MAG: 2-oxoglutarate ferredoxin oxidoreductase subunit alpha [Oligoflexia bacterium]|nr:MAG: 2-oxoglutarate ferredoxin oxidoreductase subunit alpha [Oligoflexia bacterium]